MPVQQPTANLEALNSQLTNVPWAANDPKSLSWIRRSTGPAEQVMRQMYNATKVPGVFETIPEKLRGVYWMKGNALGEELAVLQYGQWDQDSKTLAVPFSPYMWSWAAGVPADSPFNGMLYGIKKGARSGMQGLVMTGMSLFFKFQDECESSYCGGDAGPLKEAYMQTGLFGNLQEATDLGVMVDVISGSELGATGAFTLQEMDGSVDGSRWKRTCHWGLKALSPRAFLEGGSYDLLKVLDANGQPNEPYYTEFVNYMGSVPLMVWSGWGSEEVKEGIRGQTLKAISTMGA